MSIPLIVNGQTFNYPVNFDEGWGVDATGWAQAVTNGMLQRAGGNFPLLADANFGASFGLVAPYYKSHSANIATTGLLRMAKTDTIEWRNNANSADNILSVNSIDELLYNGVVIAAASGVTSIIGTANQIIASSPTGAVTLSTPQSIGTGSSPTFLGLTLTGLTPSTVLTTNGSDILTSASTTVTELGFVHGVTSSIQTQITAVSAIANAALPETGGTMSGNIAMGANKITGLGNGTAASDAAAFGQIPVFTDWAAYTPTITGLGTVTSSFFWMRMGNQIFVNGTFEAGTVPVGTSVHISLPGGFSINSSKMPASETTQLGTSQILLIAAGPTVQTLSTIGKLFFDGVDTTNVFWARSTGSGNFIKMTGDAAFSNNDFASCQFSFPI